MRFACPFLLASVMLVAPLHQSLAQPAPVPPPSSSPAAPPQSDIAAEPDAMSEKAAELFREAVKLFRDKKFAQAEVSFEAAWALNRTHKTASNLGQAEMALGKYREAAEHFAFAVRVAPASDPVRANNEKRLAAMKAKLATLNVTANVAGSEVLIGGKKVADTPLVDPIFVDPGKIKVRVRHEGYPSFEKELDVTAGQEVALDVKLEVPAPQPTATSTASVTAPVVTPRSTVPAFVIGGVAVASLIAGGVLVGIAESTRADLSDGPKKGDGSPLCTKTVPAGTDVDPACARLRSLAGERATMGNVGIGLFAVGGVALAGAAAYFFWPQPAAGSARSSKVVPIVGTNGAGVLWQGSF